MVARLRWAAGHAFVSMLLGASVGLVLYGMLFVAALTLCVPHLGRLQPYLVLIVGPCTVAGFILGLVHGYRGREFHITPRTAKRAAVITGLSVPLWFALTPIGRDLVVASFTQEKFHDYRPARFWKRAVHSSNDQLFIAAVEANDKLGDQIAFSPERCFAALKSPESAVRLAGAKALGSLKNQAKEVVSVLIKALNDKDEEVRDAAIASLGSVGGPEATAAIPQLLNMAVQDRDVRFQVSKALSQMGPDAVLDLLVYLDERKWRGIALHALAFSELGDGAPVALDRGIEFLGDPEISQEWGMWALASLCNRVGKPAIDRLHELLKGGDARKRDAALESIRTMWMRPDALDSIPALLTVIQRSGAGFIEREAGAKAAEILWSIDREVVRSLLQDKNPVIRGQAAKSMTFVTSGSSDHAALLKALDDTNLFVRVRAAASLWNLDKDPRCEAVLKEGLRSRDPELQRFVVELLVETETLEQYRESLKGAWNRGGVSRLAVARTVWELDRDPEALRLMLESLAPYAWPAAVFGLRKAGSAAVPAIPTLRAMLKRSSSQHRAAAAIVLAGIAGADALPDLVPLLADSNFEVVGAAARAMGDIGPGAAPAVLALEANLPRCRLAGSNLSHFNIVVSLWKIQRSRSALDRVLREGLFGGCGSARLAGITPKDIPWLFDAYHDPSLRWQALYALGNLESKEALPGLYAELGWGILTLEYNEKQRYTCRLASAINWIDKDGLVRRQVIARIVFCVVAGIALAVIVTLVPLLARCAIRLRIRSSTANVHRD